MNLDEMISALNELKEKHGGDVDVTMWEYGGGMDDLRDVNPVFSTGTHTVVIESTGDHGSGARR